jgi:hypothetical protein
LGFGLDDGRDASVLHRSHVRAEETARRQSVTLIMEFLLIIDIHVPMIYVSLLVLSPP